MNFPKLALCLGTVIASAAVSAPLHAQEGAAGGMFSRDNNISVLERARPEYGGNGFQNGAFIFQPQLTLGLEHDDNVFATAANEESDTILSAAAALDVTTTWSRHSLDANFGVTQREYQDFSDESTFDWQAGVSGRLDVVRGTYFEAGISFADETEPRTSAGASGQAAEPVEYSTYNAFLGATREYGRWRANAQVDFTPIDYEDTTLFGGAPLDVDFRDHESLVYAVRGDYAVSPDTSVFVRAAVNNREYDLAPPVVVEQRDSSGYTVDLGADFDIRGTARGEVAVGYTEQDYDSASFDSESGLSINAAVEWFPTQLTTLGLSATREIRESAVDVASGTFDTSVVASVDHELRRDTVVSAAVYWSESSFNGLDRTDQRTGFNAGVTYLVNANVGLRADYSYEEQDSGGSAGIRDFKRNVFGVRLVLRP